MYILLNLGGLYSQKTQGWDEYHQMELNCCDYGKKVWNSGKNWKAVSGTIRKPSSGGYRQESMDLLRGDQTTESTFIVWK